MNEIIMYNNTDNIVSDISKIVEDAQRIAYQSVNTTLVLRNWLLGKRIAEDNMEGTRAERYGTGIISDLADELTRMYGKGFDKRSLYRYVQFYQQYPDIVGLVSPQLDFEAPTQIVGSVTPQSAREIYIRTRDQSCRGLIMRDFCKYQIRRQEHGMKKKQLNNPGQ